MKRLLIILGVLFFMFMTSVVYADVYLAVDNPAPFVPTVCEIEVDGVVQPGLVTILDAQTVLIYNVTTMVQGQHTFKARWHDGSGWWSDWSDPPFVAGKPGITGNARIIEN